MYVGKTVCDILGGEGFLLLELHILPMYKNYIN